MQCTVETNQRTEAELLGRALTVAEVREVPAMTRLITALLMLSNELKTNYLNWQKHDRKR